MKRTWLRLIGLLLCAGIAYAGWQLIQAPPPPAPRAVGTQIGFDSITQAVMSPGDVITVTTRQGELKVTATSTHNRKFEWSGYTWEGEYSLATKGVTAHASLPYRGVAMAERRKVGGLTVVPEEYVIDVDTIPGSQIRDFINIHEGFKDSIWSMDGLFLSIIEHRTPSGEILLGVSIALMRNSGDAQLPQIPPCDHGSITWVRANPEGQG